MAVEFSDAIWAKAGVIIEQGAPVFSHNLGFVPPPGLPAPGQVRLTLDQDVDGAESEVFLTVHDVGGPWSISYTRPDDTTIDVFITASGSPSLRAFDILVLRHPVGVG